jgi:Cleft lip and palate transmembrane protein 1 (CLPTM1)
VTQFLLNQFFGSKQQGAGTTVQTANLPAFTDRPSISDVSNYSPVPDAIAPMWPADSTLDISICVSPSIQFLGFPATAKSALVVQEKSFKMGDFSENGDIVASIKVPKEVQQNGTLWAHFFVGLAGHQLDPAAKDYDAGKAVHFVRPLNHYLPKKQAKKLKNLLASGSDTDEVVDGTPAAQIVSYYHPNFTVSVISDSGIQKYQLMHPALRQHVQLESTGARDITGQNGWYYPIVFMNTFWQLKSHMVELNSTVETLPIHITLNNLKNWKFSLMASMDDGMKQTARQAASGGSMPAGSDGTEFEMLKEVLLDTNIYLLCTTGVVSVLHMVFETLAFKNDIVSDRILFFTARAFY